MSALAQQSVGGSVNTSKLLPCGEEKCPGKCLQEAFADLLRGSGNRGVTARKDVVCNSGGGRADAKD